MESPEPAGAEAPGILPQAPKNHCQDAPVPKEPPDLFGVTLVFLQTVSLEEMIALAFILVSLTVIVVVAQVVAPPVPSALT